MLQRYKKNALSYSPKASFYIILTSNLQSKLVNLQVLELSLATQGVEFHILVWSYREDEVGHGDTAAIYEEFYR